MNENREMPLVADDPEREPLATERLQNILEALLMAADEPVSIDRLARIASDELGVSRVELRAALDGLADALQGRAVELREVAAGYRIQVRADYSEWVSRLWKERPPRLTRALLETLALIIYRQPVTRGEIEEIRGVSTSPNIIRTLFERGWIRELGVREVPGRPSLLGTSADLLNDLNLRSLDELPSLPEIKDLEQLEAALLRLGASRDAEQAKGAVKEIGEQAAAEAEALAEDADEHDELGLADDATADGAPTTDTDKLH